MNESDVMRSTNITSSVQSNSNSEDAQRGSDQSGLKAIDKTSMSIASNEATDSEVSALGNTKTVTGVNEIDSSISKSVVLSSADDILTEKNTKEDSMEVDTECTGSESHIRTSSSIM